MNGMKCRKFGSIVSYEKDGVTFAQNIADPKEIRRNALLRMDEIVRELRGILEQIYNKEGRFSELEKRFFELINELAEYDPKRAADEMEAMYQYAANTDNVGLRDLSEMYLEILTHMEDESYPLDRAIEIAQKYELAIDTSDPLDGLYDRFDAKILESTSELMEFIMSPDFQRRIQELIDEEGTFQMPLLLKTL